MYRMINVVTGLGVLWLLGTTSVFGQDSLRVGKMVICRQVVDRQPQEIATTFPDTVKTVFCFTHIEGAREETSIKHRWFWKDSLLAEVTLPVRSASWRTWSSKRIVKGWRGDWRVEVTDALGKNLKTTTFRIEKSGK